MNRLSTIFYILFLSGCGLFFNESINQKDFNNTIYENDNIAIDSLLILEDSLSQASIDFKYPTFSKDIFHLISTQKISGQNLIFLDMKSYVYSNKLNIAYSENDN